MHSLPIHSNVLSYVLNEGQSPSVHNLGIRPSQCELKWRETAPPLTNRANTGEIGVSRVGRRRARTRRTVPTHGRADADIRIRERLDTVHRRRPLRARRLRVPAAVAVAGGRVLTGDESRGRVRTHVGGKLCVRRIRRNVVRRMAGDDQRLSHNVHWPRRVSAGRGRHHHRISSLEMRTANANRWDRSALGGWPFRQCADYQYRGGYHDSQPVNV
jgi:hypothetical protein